MELYKIDIDKKEKTIRAIVQKKIKNEKGFVRFCYILTAIIKILGIILGCANVIHVIVVSHDAYELILLIVTFGCPMLISLLPATVYYGFIGKNYRFRDREIVTFNQDEFVYSYGSFIGDGPDRCFYKIKYSDISEIICDEKSKLVEIHGKVKLESSGDSIIIKEGECKVFDFIDTYEINVADKIKQNMKYEV